MTSIMSSDFHFLVPENIHKNLAQIGKVVSIIIIIIISIFKEDNVFSISASLPYGPPVNTDIDYYQTFFRTCLFLQVLRG